MCVFIFYTHGLDDCLIGSILSPGCWIILASPLKKEEERGEQMTHSPSGRGQLFTLPVGLGILLLCCAQVSRSKGWLD